MTITSIQTGRTIKRVNFNGVRQSQDESLVKQAMEATDESPSSLFDWHVERHPVTPNTATVVLHID